MTVERDIGLYAEMMASSPKGFADALADAKLGIFFTDWVAQEFDYNSVLRTAFGLPETGKVNREDSFQHLVHPDDVDMMRRLADENLSLGRPYSFRHRMRRADGRYFPCITHVKPIIGESGTVEHAIGIMRDQDEQERAMSRMVRAEKLAGMGNWYVDLPSGHVTWSDDMFAIYGYERGEIEPDLNWVRSRYLDDDAERVSEIVDEALENGTDFRFRARIVTKNGDKRHVNVVGEVEFGADDEPIAYAGIVQDVTEEVLREAQIMQSQKIEAIGNMTGGAAHDFNNLLTVILGNLEFLREEIDRPELLDHCEAAISAALSGAALTRNMLSFARRAQLDPKTIDINDAVRSLERWARRTLSATIEPEVSLQAGLWRTDLDQPSLETALLNLMLNARDAMSDGGKLTIETANVRIDDDYIASRREDIEPGRYVMLAVSDTGTGIPSEELERIFEPFFTTKGTGEGTGLGLSMIQGFVKQSGGAIRVYSEVGEGTTFKLYFRARHMESRPHPDIDTPAPTARIEGRHRILLAEDQLDVQRVIAATLRNGGYEVHATNSGDEALAAFQIDQSYDLLLTDIVMPGSLQGTALAKRLRAIRADLPVVFMSGYANEATVHGNGLRPEDIRLMKPIRRVDLLNAVKNAIAAKN